MRKINLIIFFLAFLYINSYSQIWFEDFDGSNTTNPVSISTACNGSVMGIPGSAYSGIVCGFGGGCGNELSPANTASYTSLMGNFFGVRDSDNANGNCGTDIEFAEWTGINISSCNPTDKLYLCMDIAEGDETPGLGYWDGPSEVFFSVNIDNAGAKTLAALEQTNIGAGNTDTYASFDEDCDENGDNLNVLTATYTTYCFQIPGFGSSLDIRIDIDGLNQFGEDIAIDNVGVYCAANPSAIGIEIISCGDCSADMDCDGVLCSDECDDNDPNNTSSNAGDFDCDGVPTAIDCDDNDPLNMNTNVGDGDCDLSLIHI